MAARWLAGLPWRQVGSDGLVPVAAGRATPGWRDLPLAGRLYVASVIVAGGTTLVVFFPRQIPDPVLFTGLALFAWLTSAWKVTLPLPIVNGSTLSVSYAANLMSLLLLGPSPTLVIAVAAFWIQCTYKPKHPYPLHRTIFSAATGALTMLVTSVVFTALDGPETPLDSFALARPLVGAIATYFTVNTGLIACAIALSSSASCLATWRREFLWSGASFMVAGTAGAIAAALLQRGEIWKVVILIAPIYLTYRTYELFSGRLDDEKRHSAEIRRLHQQTMSALDHARQAEQALAAEKERLAVALASMTRLEQARNQLLELEQAARASAEEANRLKDQFLAVVSHELRTPLNAIVGWSDMLGKRSLDEELRERAVLGIGQSARRQAQLIEDLLDVARITSGKLRLDRSLVDLRATVRDAVEIVQPTAQARRIEIVVDFDRSCAEVFGDGARLQQIALNLLSNAVKFTLEGGTVRASVRGAGDFVELRVSDTGKGIAPEFLPWVFEPFRQGDAGAARVHAGLGLGLSIVKTLVEAHNGHVSAHSAGEGRGATFTVLLPATTASERSQASARRRQAPVAAAARSATSLDGLSVLLVDDDDECREVVAAQLQSSRAYVLTASSAAEAIDLLQRKHVDVLLADIGMPEEDGYQLIRRVRAFSSTTASIPAAAITAFARDEDRRAALAAGFQLHLPKPVDADSLLSAVASLGRMHAV